MSEAFHLTNSLLVLMGLPPLRARVHAQSQEEVPIPEPQTAWQHVRQEYQRLARFVRESKAYKLACQKIDQAASWVLLHVTKLGIRLRKALDRADQKYGRAFPYWVLRQVFKWCGCLIFYSIVAHAIKTAVVSLCGWMGALACTIISGALFLFVALKILNWVYNPHNSVRTVWSYEDSVIRKETHFASGLVVVQILSNQGVREFTVPPMQA